MKLPRERSNFTTLVYDKVINEYEYTSKWSTTEYAKIGLLTKVCSLQIWEITVFVRLYIFVFIYTSYREYINIHTIRNTYCSFSTTWKDVYFVWRFISNKKYYASIRLMTLAISTVSDFFFFRT